MMTGPTLCVGCLHLHRDTSPRITYSPMTCTAYPDAIPSEVEDGTIDHRQPYLGDRGVQFVELLEGTAATYDRRKQRPEESRRRSISKRR